MSKIQIHKPDLFVIDNIKAINPEHLRKLKIRKTKLKTATGENIYRFPLSKLQPNEEYEIYNYILKNNIKIKKRNIAKVGNKYYSGYD